jgi:thiaminase
MLQDYHFLTHFSRSNALAAYKTTRPSQIAASAKIILHVDKEMDLHRTLCAKYGVAAEEMDGGEEDLACVAYTRWVLDVGAREDWFALQVAMMPCLFGYGEIAQRLYVDPHTKRGPPFQGLWLIEEGNEYLRWIENYVAEDFQEAVHVGRTLLEENAVEQSPERIAQLIEIFRQGTLLEAAFWQMGLTHAAATTTTITNPSR